MYTFPKIIFEMPQEKLVSLIINSYAEIISLRGQTPDLDGSGLRNVISRIASSLQSRDKTGLILSGGYGVGKSSILRAIRVGTCLGTLRTADEIYHYYKTSEALPGDWKRGVLYIDDLGSEPYKCLIYGEQRFPIVELLCNRYDTLAPTIIATNLSEEGLRNRYGDRVYDRIVEQYELIVLTNPSFRSRIKWDTLNK